MGPVKQRFDDGGISGGTMEQPALQRLLDDIDAGLVRMVVVYKIDRLTWSLADFARLVEGMEAAGCSFVSVTQAFNTSSSMGRLTLNMLLSFAQFEREVTAERIRDKLADSKAKGLWMGGLAPLGYDPDPDPAVRSLIVNAAEARIVQTLFNLYDEYGCLREVVRKAAQSGIRSKPRAFEGGRCCGGRVMSRGQIHYLLCNPIYIGKIRHKDRIHDGRHEAIVDVALFERVQENLKVASGRKRKVASGTAMAVSARTSAHRAWLTGLPVDETGDRLTPTHTVRRGRRYDYYASSRGLRGEAGADPQIWRLPARQLHGAIAAAISGHLSRRAENYSLITSSDPVALKAVTAAATALTSGSPIRLITSGA